jgi:hypothetical protein
MMEPTRGVRVRDDVMRSLIRDNHNVSNTRLSRPPVLVRDVLLDDFLDLAHGVRLKRRDRRTVQVDCYLLSPAFD